MAVVFRLWRCQKPTWAALRIKTGSGEEQTQAHGHDNQESVLQVRLQWMQFMTDYCIVSKQAIPLCVCEPMLLCHAVLVP